MNLTQRPEALHCSNRHGVGLAAWSRRAAWTAVAAWAVFLGQPADARTPLGVFGNWAAFRDSAPPQCYAIAAPVARRRNARFPPFVAVTDWPARALRSQVHVRLREPRKAGAPVTLSIGLRRFRLIGSGADAWAADARADRAIVAAMRGGPSLSVETVDARGKPLVDVYRLDGAATAIDAAVLGCARP